MNFELQRFLDAGISPRNLNYFQRIPMPYGRTLVRNIGTCCFDQSWDHRIIPAHFFSANQANAAVELRKHAALFLFHFCSALISFGLSGSLNSEEVRRDQKLKLKKLKKAFKCKLTKRDTETLEIQIEEIVWRYALRINPKLELALNSYDFLRHDFSSAKQAFALSFNQCLNLIRGWEKSLFFLDKCHCQKPILIPNEPLYTIDQKRTRFFFTCPWCKAKFSDHKLYFEELLNRHSEWVGLADKEPEDDKGFGCSRRPSMPPPALNQKPDFFYGLLRCEKPAKEILG